MNCNFCNTQYEGNICPNCGAPAPANQPNAAPIKSQEKVNQPPPSTYPPVYKPKPKKSPLPIILVSLFVGSPLLTGFLSVLFLFFDAGFRSTGSHSTGSPDIASSAISYPYSESALSVSSSQPVPSQSLPVWPPEPTSNFTTLTSDEYMAIATPFDYDSVIRYPNDFIGVDLALRIKIASINDTKNGKLLIGFLQNPDGTYYSYKGRSYINIAVNVLFPEDSPTLYKDDSITVYGEFNSIKSFENMWSKTSVPAINGRYFIIH